MDFTLSAELTGRGYRVVKARAVIKPNKKLGILKRAQKTWNVRTVAPQFAAVEYRNMFEAESRRWEARVMPELMKVKQPEPKQEELV